jgi:hypothetical protein
MPTAPTGTERLRTAEPAVATAVSPIAMIEQWERQRGLAVDAAEPVPVCLCWCRGEIWPRVVPRDTARRIVIVTTTMTIENL